MNLFSGLLHITAIINLLTGLQLGHAAQPNTSPPLEPGVPFLFMWNAPTELCGSRFGIELDLSYFQMVSSTLKTATNQSVAIFYTDRFGLFPYVDEETEEFYDEGLPQLVDLKEHKELAEDDIDNYIPDNLTGLAILDFEEWRPQWIRNWGSKDIYREKSIEVIMKKRPHLSYEEAEDLAIERFERGAKAYFLKSLKLGKKLRPNRRWGYYLYPDCYNYDYNKDMEGFTGECPAIEKKRNNNLYWLWQECTALYPSIYLELVLRESRQAKLYVRHRIQEAMRVSTLNNQNYSTPIYAYIRPVFKDSDINYLSEYDLVNTIGEAAALGSAGVVSWGDMDITDTEETCEAARRHLEKVMNPYIVNVTTAAQLCSRALCQENGRCVRKKWNKDVYLHLDPRYYRIRMDQQGRLFVKGELSQGDIDWFAAEFDCLCYSEEPCQYPLVLNAVTNFVHATSIHLQFISLTLLLICIMFSMHYACS